jgi:hypothetical protein
MPRRAKLPKMRVIMVHDEHHITHHKVRPRDSMFTLYDRQYRIKPERVYMWGKSSFAQYHINSPIPANLQNIDDPGKPMNIRDFLDAIDHLDQFLSADLGDAGKIDDPDQAGHEATEEGPRDSEQDRLPERQRPDQPLRPGSARVSLADVLETRPAGDDTKRK